MEPFAVVLDAEAGVTVTAAHFEDAFRQLPELLLADSASRKLHASSLLKIPISADHTASSAPEAGEIIEGETSSSPNSSRPDALDLAATAFTCQEVACTILSARRSYLFG